MAGRWERFSKTSTLTTVGLHSNSELFHNAGHPASGGDNLVQRDVVIVDGIVTIHSDTDALIGTRLVVANELIVDGDLSDTIPEEHSDMIYYSWFTARGPSYFRLRSKKSIHPEEKLWLTIWKEQEATSTIVHAGLRLFLVPKGGN